MLSEEQIFEFLQKVGPHEENPAPLLLFKVHGEEYQLRVDVNNQDDKYGYMWEWWLENQAGYVDGGFQPANNSDELRLLAAHIHATGVALHNKEQGISPPPVC
jgi:hypothetical protein